MKATGNNRKSLGCEPVNHKHTDIAGGTGAVRLLPVPSDNDRGPPSADRSNYFCRGCGARLPLGFRGHFHTECLRADKRRRVRARRVHERRRFGQWLQNMACPRCGAKYGNAVVDQLKEYPCEASQGGWEGPNP